jgi:hypothetical protein
MWHQTMFSFPDLASHLRHHPPPARCRAMKALGTALAAALVLVIGFAPGLASAQDSGSEGWTSSGTAPRSTGHRWSLGVEVSKPLILGVEGTYHFDPRVAASLGFAALSGFTAISGEVDYHVLRFDAQGLSALTGVGFAQYFLAEGGKESQPTMAHALVGIENVFQNRVGVGMNLGYQVAIGSSGDESVDRYGIHANADGWFFGMNARYVF